MATSVLRPFLEQPNIEHPISPLPPSSQSDPIAAIFTSLATGTTQWKEVGRTDVVANTPGAAALCLAS